MMPEKRKSRMKNNFDLTPLVRQGGTPVIIRTALCVLVLAVITRLAGRDEISTGLFRGMVVGALDMVIMCSGARKALAFKDDPERGVKLLKRYRYYRIFAAGSLFVAMLKMKYHVFYVAVGFLLTHIFYILNLIFIACQLQKEEEREERSVKDGK